jgi:hypothetical protein
MLPPSDKLTICFAHVAYRLHERYSALDTGINSFAVRDPETLDGRIGEADVLVISGLWHNGLLDHGRKLRLIQAIGAGTDQFPREELARRGIRLASARGVNYRAVAEHAMALILALSRRLPEARDNQAKRVWRGMIGDPAQREDELGGKTLLIVGLGQIGGRLAQLAKAFDMRVVGLRRDPAAGRGAADAVHTMNELMSLLPEADCRSGLPAERGNGETGQRRGARPDETHRLSCEHRSRTSRRRASPCRGAGCRPDRRRRNRCDNRRATGGEFAAMENGARPDHPPYGRRDAPLRGQCDRDLA